MASYAPHLTQLAVTASAGSGLIIGRDEGDGIIRVAGVGSWTPDEVDSHFDRLSRLIAQARATDGFARVLIDLRHAEVQSPETADRVQLHTGIYKARDRVALVMANSLAKMQMRQVIRSMEFEMFISPGAAMTWLCAYTHDRRRPHA